MIWRFFGSRRLSSTSARSTEIYFSNSPRLAISTFDQSL